MLEVSIKIAVLAVVYRFILSIGILNFWFRFGLKFEKYKFIFEPIWNCVYCISGQVSFWLYIYFNYDKIDLISLILFITQTIFITHLIKFIYKKTDI